MQALMEQIYRKPGTVAYSERCTANVFIPDQANGDAVLWLHGGGLTVGDKGTQEPPVLVPEGCALVSANYRLLHHAPFPACVEDAAAALAWVPQILSTANIEVKRLFIAGESAGAYLAAMVSCDPRWISIHSVTPLEIAGAFLLSGQMSTHFAVKMSVGINRTRPMIDERAPMWHVDADLPPMRCVIGDDDNPCRLEENYLFAASLKAHGHKYNDVHVIEGRTHGTIGAGMRDAKDEVNALFQAFITNPQCTAN